ncbi:PilZ domain-containing protein [Erythrobacter sp. HL-111]|nr:PilZ domain-containing protein [Erythrobacter sp. HL-111]KPP85097.1 MAG: PilZ domain [Erythrobacteraceae bacterium HL-111]SDS17309.1 PilZ domain-containing protein [Erythrobacter sp. HL-111]
MSISHDGESRAPFACGSHDDKVSFGEATDFQDETPSVPPPPERRADRRVVSAFRPGCVLSNGRMLLGIIRNLSSGGVMIELDEPIEPGTRVRYFWDETNVIDAVVAWVDGRAHGLENAADARPFANPFPYRSVRVPCAMRAEIFAGGMCHFAALENLSLGGMRVSGFKAPAGVLLTVRLGGVEFAGASVRWSQRDETGIRFAAPLTRAQLARILTGMSETADLPEDRAARAWSDF